MQLVRQTEDKTQLGHRRAARPRGRFGVALAAVLVAALGTACSSAESGAPDKAEKAKTGKGAEAAAGALSQAERLKAAQQARIAAAKKWGLAKPPLTAPAAPKEKPEITTRDGFEVEDGDELPPVFTTVPTEDKVVFLTIDDGAEKDPEFVKMMQELKIPYTAFLSDYLVRDNYAYFKEMQAMRRRPEQPHAQPPLHRRRCRTRSSARRSAASRTRSRRRSASGPPSSARRTATTTRTRCSRPSPAASRRSRCGTPRPSRTGWTTGSGTATCTPVTSSSRTSGGARTGRAPCLT